MEQSAVCPCRSLHVLLFLTPSPVARNHNPTDVSNSLSISSVVRVQQYGAGSCERRTRSKSSLSFTRWCIPFRGLIPWPLTGVAPTVRCRLRQGLLVLPHTRVSSLMYLSDLRSANRRDTPPVGHGPHQSDDCRNNTPGLCYAPRTNCSYCAQNNNRHWRPGPLG
jgi:hypothetical protein